MKKKYNVGRLTTTKWGKTEDNNNMKKEKEKT